MAKRSLKASETGQIEAKLAFERTGWTQAQLATQVGLGTRQSVWKFFTGRPVDRSIFVDLCYQLDLEWESIVDTPVIKAKTQPAQSSVSAVKTRLLEKLQSSLSKTTMPFDICQPLPLNQIYTPQFFLPTISSQRWLERHELPAMHPGRMTAKTTANHAATQFAQHHQKLVILGNPGSGKTTLLHHLASQCWSSEIYADSIPVFISLRSFVVQHPDCQFPALDAYLETQFLAIAPSLPISELLQQGKFLVLIDGLDEVGLEAMSPL
ncbi:MAG: NACHT domain-containing protein, partial [Cyanobacteria bacterium P01_F01_bin.42]